MRAVTAVLFDFHATLVSGGDPATWLADAWTEAGRPADPSTGLGAGTAAAAAAFLDRVWDHARDLDPHSERDRSPQRHRAVFDATIARAPGVDPELGDALYRTMSGRWRAYEDTAPTLGSLRAHGIRTAVVSNIGFDLGPVLTRNGLAGLVDAVVMSYQVGTVKPAPGIFREALDRVGSTAEDALMVGDSWLDDAGAGALGIRTLLLPRTAGPVHGLEAVLRLVLG